MSIRSFVRYDSIRSCVAWFLICVHMNWSLLMRLAKRFVKQIHTRAIWIRISLSSENLDSWLAASLLYQANYFAGSIFARRHLMKLISDKLLRQCKGLMIYNTIKRVLVTTKQILNYYNTDLSLEITSKVSQKYTFIHKLTTKPLLF